MQRKRTTAYTLAMCLVAAPAIAAAPAPEAGALARMPVREITVFKDGLALMVHEGTMPTDGDGNVQMDYLPTPVLGTFWPYSRPNGPKLVSVVASPRRVKITHTSLNLKEMIDANSGDDAQITEVGGKRYAARIVGIPARSSDELARTGAPDTGERLPETSDIVLLKTEHGTEALPLSRIADVTFGGKYQESVSAEEFRNLLTLKLDWSGRARAHTADVGMMYLQRGIRWIPSYKVDLDGKGAAHLSLQATLVNDMTDLQNVTANLVIGVPAFAYQDMIDPIALQQAAAQLSPYFAPNSSTSYALSNGIASQAAGLQGGFGANGHVPVQRAPANEENPEVLGSGSAEDLFVFTVHHVTLNKGQRMTLPVVEIPLTYHDVYTVNLPFTPPREMARNGNITDEQREMIRASLAPKAEHIVRITDNSKYPLTTAPALILSGGRVISQAMMTYTPAGSDVDLKLTTAVNIHVKKTDREVTRVPDAAHYQGNVIGKVSLTGELTITNYTAGAVTLEVTRSVLGNVDSANHDGKTEMVNTFEDDSYTADSHTPYWWGWYFWPAWWTQYNGVGRIRWNFSLEPSKSMELGYKWNYYTP